MKQVGGGCPDGQGRPLQHDRQGSKTTGQEARTRDDA